jgi:hypothetical protein
MPIAPSFIPRSISAFMESINRVRRATEKSSSGRSTLPLAALQINESAFMGSYLGQIVTAANAIFRTMASAWAAEIPRCAVAS